MSTLLYTNTIFNKIYQLIDIIEQKMLTDDDIKRKEMLKQIEELNKKMDQLQEDYLNLALSYSNLMNGENTTH